MSRLIPIPGARAPGHMLGSIASRRHFLQVAGLTAGVLALGCDDDDDGGTGPDPDPEVTLDFSNDFGVLNYAFALEQLEAAFYTQVLMSPYSGMTADETSVLTDIRDHEIAHREFFRAAIPALGGTAIPDLEVDFGAVQFTSRQSVLETARTFEDLGVSAYNGAARYVSMADVLAVAGSIVAVEGRHASVIRELLDEPFAPDAFDGAATPSQVLAAADQYITTEIALANVPSSSIRRRS